MLKKALSILPIFKNLDKKQTIFVYGLFVVLFISSLVLRYDVRDFVSGDYTIYLSHWYDYLHVHGLSAFKDNFANYNVPYLYLLYIATFLPVSKIVAIKLISILFDFVLAFAVYKLVKFFKPKGVSAIAGFFVILFLPSVFINSSVWGQCDAIYTAFLIFSLTALLKGKHGLSWVFWGIAFAFKLQAIFFLPVLILLFINSRMKWHKPLLAVVVAFIPSVIAMLLGRPIIEALNVYGSQVGDSGTQHLAMAAPTLYQWIPDYTFPYMSKAGIFLAGAVIVGLLIFMTIQFKNKHKPEYILLAAIIFTMAMPFFLPQMHDRYFFPAEILIVVFAILKPRYLFVAVGSQLVALLTYSVGLFGVVLVPLPIVSIGVLALIIFAVQIYARREALTFRDKPVRVG